LIGVADFAVLGVETGMRSGVFVIFEALALFLPSRNSAEQPPRISSSDLLYCIGRLPAEKVSKVIALLPQVGIQNHAGGSQVFASPGTLSESITCCYDKRRKVVPNVSL
jgi:hypothetical protein